MAATISASAAGFVEINLKEKYTPVPAVSKNSHSQKQRQEAAGTHQGNGVRPRSASAYSDSVIRFYQTDLTGTVWPLGVYPELEFPQIKQKSNFGVAISGGGLPAACLSLGWLRSLNKHGLLTRARFLSVSSGSAWVSLPLLWSVQMGNGNMLIKKTTAELDAVYQRIIAFASNRLRKALSCKIGDKSFGKTLDYDTLVDGVEAMFCAVDSLGEPEYFHRPQDSVETSRLPFLIVNSAIGACSGDSICAVPFEFTPVYCGCPIDPGVIDPAAFGSAVQGGFIHKSVFGTNYSSVDREVKDGKVQTYSQSECFSMATVSSILDSAVSLKRTNETIQAHLESNYLVTEQYWSRSDSTEKSLEGGSVRFVDAESVDHTGVLALLRRGVKEIVALCAIEVDIIETNEQVLVDHLHPYVALFGCLSKAKHVKGVADIKMYNKQRTVFPRAAWAELLSSLRKKRSAGEALVHAFTSLEVKDNKGCGVKAGTVDITFIFNGRSEKCPKVDYRQFQGCGVCSTLDTMMNLSPIRWLRPKSLGPDFPFIKRTEAHLSQELVDALCDQAEWSLDGHLRFFSQLLDMSESEYNYL
jgi:hypothetical protein